MKDSYRPWRDDPGEGAPRQQERKGAHAELLDHCQARFRRICSGRVLPFR